MQREFKMPIMVKELGLREFLMIDLLHIATVAQIFFNKANSGHSVLNKLRKNIPWPSAPIKVETVSGVALEFLNLL